MTKDQLLKRIAQLGSLPYQERWVVHGDATEYVLLDELIETTIYAARHRATHPVLSKDLCTAERDALVKFHDQVDELYGQIPWNNPQVSNADIVENNHAMRRIREVAQECLHSLGVQFTWEELAKD